MEKEHWCQWNRGLPPRQPRAIIKIPAHLNFPLLILISWTNKPFSDPNVYGCDHCRSVVYFHIHSQIPFKSSPGVFTHLVLFVCADDNTAEQHGQSERGALRPPLSGLQRGSIAARKWCNPESIELQEMNQISQAKLALIICLHFWNWNADYTGCSLLNVVS